MAENTVMSVFLKPWGMWGKCRQGEGQATIPAGLPIPGSKNIVQIEKHGKLSLLKKEMKIKNNIGVTEAHPDTIQQSENST